MTLEEAGQRILEGATWEYCPRCRGLGNKEGESLNDCPPCAGSGEVVTEDYAVACQVLDMPLPILPPIGLLKRSERKMGIEMADEEDEYFLLHLRRVELGHDT